MGTGRTVWLLFVCLECAIRNTGKYDEMVRYTGPKGGTAWNLDWKGEGNGRRKRNEQGRGGSIASPDGQTARDRPVRNLRIQSVLTVVFV